MQENKRIPNDKAIGAGLVLSTIVGWLFGNYTGMMFLIPAIGSVIIWWLLKTYFKDLNQTLIFAVSVIGGHLFWFVIGGVLSKSVELIIIDVLLMGGGLIWLLLTKSFAPAICLILFQVGMIVLSIPQILSMSFGANDHKSLSVHLFFRVVAVILLIRYLIEKKELHCRNRKLLVNL